MARSPGTGQQTAYDGLLRAGLLASIAGASGAEADEIAEESVARLLVQDGVVNNPKASVRSTAVRLAGSPAGAAGGSRRLTSSTGSRRPSAPW